MTPDQISAETVRYIDKAEKARRKVSNLKGYQRRDKKRFVYRQERPPAYGATFEDVSYIKNGQNVQGECFPKENGKGPAEGS